MKKILFTIAAVSALLCSCNKEQTVGTPAARPSEKVELAVSASANQVKATVADETSEAQINTIQVFVFRGDELDAYGSTVEEDGVTVKVICTKGTRSVWAVINADENLSGVKSLTALKAKVSKLQNNVVASGENAGKLQNFVMVGSKDATVETATTVSVDVHRLAARVWVKKITKQFASTALQAEDFEIVRIYLDNVAGDIALGEGDYTPTVWFNKMQFDSTAAQMALKDPFTLRNVNSVVADNIEFAAAKAMYAYPNPSKSVLNGVVVNGVNVYTQAEYEEIKESLEETDVVVDYKDRGLYASAQGGEWCARATRIVVEAKIGGVMYYYPIALPVLSSNKSYEITNLVITRPGSDDPESPVIVFEVPFTINVLDWEQVLLGNAGVVTI